MITAIVLIQGERDKLPETAEALADVPGITEVYLGSRRLRSGRNRSGQSTRATGRCGDKKLLRMDGIVRTNTLIAFRSYSRKDLERMWEIGLEDQKS